MDRVEDGVHEHTLFRDNHGDRLVVRIQFPFDTGLHEKEEWQIDDGTQYSKEED